MYSAHKTLQQNSVNNTVYAWGLTVNCILTGVAVSLGALLFSAMLVLFPLYFSFFLIKLLWRDEEEKSAQTLLQEHTNRKVHWFCFGPLPFFPSTDKSSVYPVGVFCVFPLDPDMSASPWAAAGSQWEICEVNIRPFKVQLLISINDEIFIVEHCVSWCLQLYLGDKSISSCQKPNNKHKSPTYNHICNRQCVTSHSALCAQ